MSRLPIAPGQVWFVDFEPVRGREQGKDRARVGCLLAVPPRSHTRPPHLVSVLPLTSVERRGWVHRVHVRSGGGWVITEQVRTVSSDRFRRYTPEIALSDAEPDDVRRVLSQMLIT